MSRTVSELGNTTEETKSENVFSGQSGINSTGSLFEEDTLIPLTPQQKELASKYYPKAVSAANTIKERIREKRFLTLAEEELIDNYSIDLLHKLARKSKSELAGALFSIGFSNFMEWGEQKLLKQKKRSIKTVSLYDEEKRLRFDFVAKDPQSIDTFLSELDVPYKKYLRRILSGEPISKIFPNKNKRRKWYRNCIPKIQEKLREVYDLPENK